MFQMKSFIIFLLRYDSSYQPVLLIARERKKNNMNCLKWTKKKFIDSNLKCSLSSLCLRSWPHSQLGSPCGEHESRHRRRLHPSPSAIQRLTIIPRMQYCWVWLAWLWPRPLFEPITIAREEGAWNALIGQTGDGGGSPRRSEGGGKRAVFA